MKITNEMIPAEINEYYEVANEENTEYLYLDFDLMIRPDSFDNYEELNYVGWIVPKTRTISDAVDEYSALILAYDEDLKDYVVVYSCGDTLDDVDLGELKDAIETYNM